MTNNNIISKLLIGTNPTLFNICILLLRLCVGVILFVAGSGKVMGWFGGFGIQTTLYYFVTKQGFSVLLTYMSAYTEFIGGFLLVLGLLTRPAAFAVMINMTVAGIVSIPRGFVTGAAYPFSLFVSAIIILIAGPMLFSLDSLIFMNRSKYY
ncbi:MAG: DoxX family protein [Ignavibacteriaceae bacterium]|nr:DoxX family protein [Ignavibacteriaceae bacterium]